MRILINKTQIESITNYIQSILNENSLNESKVVNIFYSEYDYDPNSPYKNVFFNKPEVDGKIESDTQKVIFIKKSNQKEKLQTDGKFVKQAKSGSYYVKVDNIKRYSDKENEEEVNSPDTKITENIPDKTIMSSLIKKILEKVYTPKELWKKADDYYSSGLRDIYPIGDKTGNKDETWSIMNYFDTKPEIHKMIFDQYKNEFNENNPMSLENWMETLFQEMTPEHKEFIGKLVDRQWESIKNGVQTENKVSDFFRKMFPNAKIQTFLPGSKMDRFEAVDLIINGLGIQIKPLNCVQRKYDYYLVKTYGMKDYTRKKFLDYIAFVDKNGEITLFPNENYTLVSPFEVKFNTEPVDISILG